MENKNPDLTIQPDTIQPQPPLLMKKKSNHSWTYFSILLIINNLMFIWLSPYLFVLPFAIIDIIAVRWHMKKRSPPWKALVISLVVVNAIFILMTIEGLSHSAGAMGLILLIPFTLILLIIYSIAILAYIYSHLANNRAKVIFYIVLALIVLLLALNTLLSVFYSAHN